MLMYAEKITHVGENLRQLNMATKIMCIADIHGSRSEILKCRKIAISDNIDTFLILGDFPGYGEFRDQNKSIEEIVSILNMLKDFEILAIPGNCDPRNAIEVFEEFNANLHENIRVMGNVSIVGLGGSVPTPFGTPFEMEESEIYDRLRKLVDRVETERFILALHNPPFDTECDLIVDGAHIGSRSVRSIIEEFQPSLALSSHVHESGGKRDRIGKTEIVNIGPLMNGKYAIIEINREHNVRLIQI